MANIIGTNGAETIKGKAVSDTITANQGNDTLTGGGGKDTFVYNLGDGSEHLQPLALSDLSTTAPQVDCSLTLMVVHLGLLR